MRTQIEYKDINQSLIPDTRIKIAIIRKVSSTLKGQTELTIIINAILVTLATVNKNVTLDLSSATFVYGVPLKIQKNNCRMCGHSISNYFTNILFNSLV